MFFSLVIVVTTITHAQIETEDVPQDSLPDLSLQDNFQPRFFKALSERGIENYDRAIDILKIIEKDVKDEPVVYFQLGLNYLDLEQYGMALLNLEKARKLKSENYDITEAIFKVRRAQKQYQSALDEAFKLVGKDKGYFEVIALLYMELQNYEKALNFLNISDQALGFSPAKDNIRQQIYSQYNKPEEAVKYYKQRETIEFYNPYNLYRLAIYQSRNRQTKDALISLEQLKIKHPEFSRVYVLETNIQLKNGAPEQALEALRIVVSDRFLEEKYKVEAIDYFKAFVETNPEYRDDFIQILDLASEKAEESATNLDLGLFYFETDKPKSLENFRKALKQNPQDFEILKRICVLEYQLGKLDEALNTAEKALEIYPTQVLFMLVKANVFNVQGQYNLAKSVLEEAEVYVFEENELMLMLYESLSVTYEGLGNPEKVEKYRMKVNNLKSKLN